MQTTKLPSTILQLDEIGTALTLAGARSISVITCHHYGPYKDEKTGKTPRNKQHVIDLNGWTDAAKTDHTILHRSPYILNSKRHRTIYRKVVRRLAEFLDANKNVPA